MAHPFSVPRKLPLVPVYIDQFARVHLNGTTYRKPTFSGDQCVLVREDGLSESFSQREIKDLFDAEKLRIDAYHYDPVQAITKAEAGNILFRDLPKDEQEIILYRQGFCDHVLREIACHTARRTGPRFEQSLEDHFLSLYKLALSKSKGKSGTSVTLPKKPSPSQVRRWLKRYEASNLDPLSLSDRRHHKSGNQTDRLGPDVRKLLREAASHYISEDRHSIATVYKDFFLPALVKENERRAKEGKAPLKKPNKKALERLVRSLDQYLVVAGRHTVEYARKHLTITNAGLNVRYPLERVEMDEWLIPLLTLLEWTGVYDHLTPEEKEAAKPVRVWLTAAICCATRCLVSFTIHVDSPGAKSAVQSLKLIFMDKTAIGRAWGAESAWLYYGRPKAIYVDNGPGLRSTEFHVACLSMRVPYNHTPPSEPNLRGRIESAFRKIDRRLMSHFSGRTFSNVVEKGEYEAEKYAGTLFKELLEVMSIYVVDVYHHEPHGGLLFATPFDTWNRLTENWGVDTMIDKREIRHVFGVRTRAAITSDGIEFASLHYQSKTLQRDRFKYNLRDVEISVDVDNLSEISVFLPDGAITVPCIHKEIAGVSLDNWEQLLLDHKKRNLRAAEHHLPTVMRGMEKIMATSAEAKARAAIQMPTWDSESLAKAHSDLFRTFKIAKRPEPASHGLFGNTIEGEAIEVNEPEDSTEDEYVDEPAAPVEPTSSEQRSKAKKAISGKTGQKRNTKSNAIEASQQAKPASGFKKWETED